METTRRDFIKLGIGGLTQLLVGTELIANDKTNLIKPSLEEITEFLSKNHNEILEPEIKADRIKKFPYTRQTKPEDLYEFLNKNFQNEIVFVYFDGNDNTKNIVKRNTRGKDTKATYDERLSAGSATIFLYTMLNLRKSNSDVGFLFLELTDFYGGENWAVLHAMFNNKLNSFPSYVEFKHVKGRYEFNHITESSQRNPELILEWIGDFVEDFRKRTTK